MTHFKLALAWCIAPVGMAAALSLALSDPLLAQTTTPAPTTSAATTPATLAASRPTQKSYLDYYLPTPITEELSKTVWGAPEIGPRDPKNGLEDTTAKQWCYWDGKILKAKDGKYHMFASRWDQAGGHMAWGNSLAVHAVSDKLTGPYVDKGLCWPTNQGGKGHNVTAMELPDGRYAVIVSTSRPGDVFVSNSLDGPWEQLGTIKVNQTGWKATNVCIMVRPDGDFEMIRSSGSIFLSKAKDGVLGPYEPLAGGRSIYPSGIRSTEDPVIWFSGGLYHCVVNSFSTRKSYHLVSADGINNWQNLGIACDPTANFVRYTDGTLNHWAMMERAGVYMEDGHVKAMTFACIDVQKRAELGNDNHCSKVIVVPFDGEALDRDLAGKVPGAATATAPASAPAATAP